MGGEFIKSGILRQFLSYFVVGGVAALVEWGLFALLGSAFRIPYIPATAAAFLIATLVNWLLGRRMTFRNAKTEGGKAREAAQVFLASAIGLLGNLALMYFFVDTLQIWAFGAKVISTGIVFCWNFLSRKFLIYKLK